MAVYAGAFSPYAGAVGTGRCWMGASSLHQRSDAVARGGSRHCCSEGFAARRVGLPSTSATRPPLSRPAIQKSSRKGVTTAKAQGSNDSPEPLDDAQSGTSRAAPSDTQVLQGYAEFIATADLSSGFIDVPPNLQEVLPRSLSKSIMIRDCYRLVLKKLDALGDSFAVVLSGSPGIGKSSFAVLLLHHLAKQGAKVIYRYPDHAEGDTIIYFNFSDASAIKVEMASEGSQEWFKLRRLIKRSSIWCVQDGRAPKAQFGGVGRYVVLCSPNVDNYKEFAKGDFCEVWWLPVWSLQEMQECRRRLYPKVPEETMEERIQQFGMLIRHVLGNTKRRFEDLGDSLSADQAIDLYHLSFQSLESDVRHVFAHIAVTEDLRKASFYLGSLAIKKLVFERAMEHRWKDLVDLLHAGASSSKISGTVGNSLESYGHRVLEDGLVLSSDDIKQVFRRGRGRSSKPKPDVEATPEEQRVLAQQRQTIWQIQEAFRDRKELVLDSPSHPASVTTLSQSYVQPIVQEQESWDSLVCGGDEWVNVIQFTRDPKHGLKVNGIRELLKRVHASDKNVRIVHAVPAERFEMYGWQPWEAGGKGGVLREEDVPEELKNIEQWVVKVKLPEPGSGPPNSLRSIAVK